MEQPLPPSLAALVPRLTAEASRSLRVAYAALQAERDAAVAFLARLEKRRLKAARAAAEPLTGWALHEQMTAPATVNPLPRWEAQRARWAAIQERMSAVAAKSSSAASAGARAHTPLLERYKSHRLRVERAAGVEAATLLEDRFGPAAWCASLRDNWQLCVPQGHPLLSGLGSVTSVLTPERAEVVHDPRLTIVGRGLEAGLRLLAATQPGPRECAARMAGGDPTAAAQVLEVLDDTAADDAGAPAAAGGGEAASAARPDAAPAAEAASHGEEGAPSPFPPGRGPSLALSPTRLRFDSAGEAQTVTLTNTGSVALYLSWSLADTTRDTRDAWFEPTAPRRALLPGASASLRFTFRPTERGEVKEIWALRCKPALLAGSGGGGAAQLLFEGSAARPCSRAARRGSTAGEPRRGRTTHVTSRAPMSAR